MTSKKNPRIIPVNKLKYHVDPAELSFETTADIDPKDEIIGQKRGVEAFKFGMGMTQKGYNIFVTGTPGSGRLSTVKRLLKELSHKDSVPDDLCYVNNFKNPDSPTLLTFKAGDGTKFKKDMHDFLDTIAREVPQLFESEEYIARKNQIAEAHEKKILSFYKSVEDKVKDTGLVVVRMQMGPMQRPDVLPLVDGEPKRILEVEEMVEAGRFPKDELDRLKKNRKEIKEELDQIVTEVRALNKEVAKKHREVDKLMFLHLAEDLLAPIKNAYRNKKVNDYLEAMLEDMVENLSVIKMLGQTPKSQGPEAAMMMMGPPPPEVVFQDYQVNLMVDNSERTGPPVIIESYPTYRNLFGSIERIMDRQGGWRTDYTKINAGSFVKANGGYLVVNLMDAIMEPGVWQTLKRSLKTAMIKIETYDPYYFFTATGLKPESIPMDVKVVVLGDPYLYSLLLHYDQDVPKIFKVRADYETSMDRNKQAFSQVAGFVRNQVERLKLRDYSASGVAAIIEEAIRMAGRQEKISTAFPALADLLTEADYFAKRSRSKTVDDKHVKSALDARHHRSARVEEAIQHMIDRGSLFVDTTGVEIGQVNGLAVYSMGDAAFGKPSRITVSTSMGKEGIINIEREADMSGPTHNKGVYILSGYLRRMFAQNKPLTLAASIAFEQSYGGIDGDSASSTELYALLSSLAEVPIRQDIAVTGSVNQKGEVQPIGGVNEKIEGFYLCCKHSGLTGDQGVMIPEANVKDLMLKPEIITAVEDGKFTVYSVKTINQGIEILTGLKAGTRGKNGKYTAGSVYRLVDDKLTSLAEGLRDFSKGDEENGKKDKKKKK